MKIGETVWLAVDMPGESASTSFTNDDDVMILLMILYNTDIDEDDAYRY